MNKKVIEAIREIGWHTVWIIPYFLVYAIYKNTVERIWLWAKGKWVRKAKH